MENLNIDYGLIEKYFDEKLSDTDQKLFTNNLRNSDFRIAILQQAKMLDAISNEDFGFTKRQLQKKQALPKKLILFLLFLIFIAAFLIAFSNCKSEMETSPMASLSEEYFISFPVNVVGRGETTKSIDEVILNYSLENYQLAESQILALEEPNEVLQLCLANIYMAKKNYVAAIEVLENMAVSKVDVVNENVEWYLGLGYLGSGEIEKAKEKFTLISDSKNHLYYKEASRIIQQLFLN